MDEAFERLKTKLTEEPILYASNYELEFVVQADVSELYWPRGEAQKSTP